MSTKVLPDRVAVDSNPAEAGVWNELSPDEAQIDEFGDLVNNVLMARKELFSKFIDPRRSINDECGYPETTSISPQDFRDMYDREAVAARVVEVLPKESWQAKPTIIEDEESDERTPFEEAWDKVGRGLLSPINESYFKDDQLNPIWEYLVRGDILSGIGHFGVLLLGLDDGLELQEPAEFTPGTEVTRKLTFIRAFDESLVDITAYDQDVNSPRFGQPVKYNIRLSDPRQSSTSTSAAQPSSTKTVHWTRVIHLADNLGSSEVLGVPRQRPVFNRLLDLRKLYGGSGEMYWRGAFPGLSIETHPQLGGEVRVDRDKMKDTMEQYMNGLQRYLQLTGMSAKSLAPQVSDPTKQIEVMIVAIGLQVGIPKRVFMGSERGELASGQDDRTWNDRLRQRQMDYLTPKVIIPFIDRLINLGVLPTPQEGFTVVWPNLDELSAQEKADLSVKRTEAMAKYVGGSVESLVKPMDFLTRVMDFTADEAEAILKAHLEGEPEDTESPLLGLVGGMSGMAEFLKLFGEKQISEDTLRGLIRTFFKLEDSEIDGIIADGIPEQDEPEPTPVMVPPGVPIGAAPEPAEAEEDEEDVE